MSSVRLRSDSILRAWLEANAKPRVWYPLNIYIYTPVFKNVATLKVHIKYIYIFRFLVKKCLFLMR